MVSSDWYEAHGLLLMKLTLTITDHEGGCSFAVDREPNGVQDNVDQSLSMVWAANIVHFVNKLSKLPDPTTKGLPENKTKH